MNIQPALLTKLRNAAFAPVDNASLIFFRIAFGLLMVWEVCRYFAYGWVAQHWLAPQFLFKYYGFSWVHPWPGHWLYIHWAALGLFALFIAAGFLYRISAALFFASYTYFFLLEEAWYVNHIYLICLFSFLLIFIPANRALSVDAWVRPQLRSETTPAWTLWLLRAQMGIVYFYGGVAKLSSDWLRGEPTRMRLSQNTDLPILGRFFREEWAVYAVSYGGLLLDLLIVPLLLWRRTRIVAFCVAVGFHLINARAFVIGIFPWLAICATALFFSPDWPRRVIRIIGLTRLSFLSKGMEPSYSPQVWKVPSHGTQLMVLGAVAIYLVIQLLVPISHLFFGSGAEWTSLDHRFSWRMMLVKRRAISYFYVTDPNNGRTRQIVPLQFLSLRQTIMMSFQPDLPLQFARYLAKVMPRTGPKPLRVEARIFVSINGRKPELFLDPNVDLAAESRTLGRPRWLLPIHEPLPPRQEGSAENDLTAHSEGY
jgi:vitamin K-dependent gamma-carboxylase